MIELSASAEDGRLRRRLKVHTEVLSTLPDGGDADRMRQIVSLDVLALHDLTSPDPRSATRRLHGIADWWRLLRGVAAGAAPQCGCNRGGDDTGGIGASRPRQRSMAQELPGSSLYLSRGAPPSRPPRARTPASRQIRLFIAPVLRTDSGIGSPSMDMLKGEQIAEADLTDWRKLAQGLHARYVIDDFATGAGFVAAVGEAGDALGHHPSVSIGKGYVDFKLVSDDAIYRDDEGTEHVVEWVTQQDVDLARRITEIAVDHKVDADPASVSDIELGLDTARSATIAPVWATLLTGSADAQGRGTPSDEIRDATGRVPNLWFGDGDEHEAPGQRFHIEIYVAPEVAEQRIAAAVAAGGTVVDDSDAPSLTVIADQDGNKGIVCVDASAAKKD